MTKNFCDVCGSKAEEIDNVRIFPFGESRTHPTRGGRTAIAASIGFAFENHPEDSKKEPDLCNKCASKIVRELATLIRNGDSDDI